MTAIPSRDVTTASQAVGGEFETRRPASPMALFKAFNNLALQGFGGVLPVAQRELVEKHQWLTAEQFVEVLAIGQVLPGPNICNIALMVGDRFFGLRGAGAALAGILLSPLLVVLALAILYSEFARVGVVAHALQGMGAVAAGLIIATGLKLIRGLKRNPIGMPLCFVFGSVTFVLIALLHWPLLTVLLIMGPIGMAAAWWRIR